MAKNFETVSLSHQIVSRRINDMGGTSKKGIDIFTALDDVVFEYGGLVKGFGIATVGDKAIVGHKTGLVGLCNKKGPPARVRGFAGICGLICDNLRGICGKRSLAVKGKLRVRIGCNNPA